jgi:hypothetical protein
MKNKTERKIGNRTLYPREERSYQAMLQRCYNPRCAEFKNYGGRGLRVCDRWIGSFELFYEDMGVRPAQTSIDRIDNDDGYYKENCRWASQKQQCRNTRRNSIVEYDGITKTVVEWSEETGIAQNTITYRLRRGWSTGEALGMEERVRPRSYAKIQPEDAEEMFRALSGGMSQGEYGRIVGLHSSQVSRMCKKYRTAKQATQRSNNK